MSSQWGFACGCYFHVSSENLYDRSVKRYLPLLDSEVHSTILSTTSRTVLKQTFTNPSSIDAIKGCIYTFPLFDGVSVVSFTCHVGNNILRGLVKEKQKAKDIFNDAVFKGETAGLLEQAPQASDVFSTKLGNIPAGESVVVEIIYIGELKHDAEADGLRFTIPTKIAPRYGSYHEATVHTGNLPVRTDARIKITVDVSMPDGSFIQGIQSPSHPLAVSLGTLSGAPTADPSSNKASATLSLASTALEKDFVLIILSKGLDSPKAILEMHPTIPNHRALMATLVPKFSLHASRPEIVFVADRSGSMDRNIPMLISAMKVFLKSMPPGIKFNICSFGNNQSFLWERSMSYSAETLKEGIAHIETFAANMGGTETFNAVKATIDRRYRDLPLEIILLTDGDIWAQGQLFTYVNEEVTKSSGNIRVFTLGIGNGVSHALIEGLARAGNGFAQSVQSGERLDGRVVRMLRGALSPHVTNYSLEVNYGINDADFELVDRVVDGISVLLSDPNEPKTVDPQATISLFNPATDPEKEDLKGMKDDLPVIPSPRVLQAPHKIPPLFPFSRSVIYLLLSPSTIQRTPISVTLKATSPQGPLELSIPIEVLDAPAETIHQLAAKKAVQDLEEGRGWIYDATTNGTLIKDKFHSHFDDIVQKEAVRLGEQFQIVGKWTSFVAVTANDAEIAAESKTGKLDEWEVVNSGASDDKSESSYLFNSRVTRPSYQCKASISFKKKSTSLQSPSDDHYVPPNMRGQPPASPPGGSSPQNSGVQPFSSMGSVYQAAQFQSTGYPLPPAKRALSDWSAPERSVRSDTFALRDCQMQLMLLEQQNKRRLMMARQEQNNAMLLPVASTPAHSGDFEAAVPKSNTISFARMAPVDNFSSGRVLTATKSEITSFKVSAQRNGASTASPPPPPSPKPFVVPTTTTDRVLALIERQSFEGSWDPNDKEELFAIMDLPPSHAAKFESLAGVGEEKKAFVTVLVVRFFEGMAAYEEDVWGLVVEKAKDWVVGVVGGEGRVKEMEEMVGQFLSRV